MVAFEVQEILCKNWTELDYGSTSLKLSELGATLLPRYVFNASIELYIKEQAANAHAYRN